MPWTLHDADPLSTIRKLPQSLVVLRRISTPLGASVDGVPLIPYFDARERLNNRI